jgi:hypothetical protein
MRRFLLKICVFTLLSQLPQHAIARIKLITLPERERVDIQLEHTTETLVEEERIVPLMAGNNQIDFSWANTGINADTIVFRVLAPDADAGHNDIKIVSVSYPPNEQALIWNVAASTAGTARIRISYLLQGIEKTFNYRALSTADESQLELWQYLRIANYANEEYKNSGIWSGLGQRQHTNIEQDETKQLLIQQYRSIALTKTYSTHPRQHGYINRAQNKLRIPMYYELHNSTSQGLGKEALAPGKVRIYIKDTHGNETFVGEDWGTFTAVDDTLKLYLGVAQDIVAVRTIEKSEQKRINGALYHHSVIIKYELENYKEQSVILDIHENIRDIRNELRGNNGREVEWELEKETSLTERDSEKSTYDTIVFAAQLPPRNKQGDAEKITHRIHLNIKNEW